VISRVVGTRNPRVAATSRSLPNDGDDSFSIVYSTALLQQGKHEYGLDGHGKEWEGQSY
jgi:hypothetical protein